MHEGSDKNSYNSDDRPDRTCQRGEGFLEHPTQSANFLHHLCHGSKALHGRAYRGYRFAEHNKKRTDCCRKSRNLQNGLLLRFAHAVQFIHECLHLGDHGADGGHQQLAEGDGKLLQLGFQDGQLSFQVVLHGIGHVFRHTVAVFNGRGQIVYILRRGVHQGEKAGHGILANKRLRRSRRLRLGQT